MKKTVFAFLFLSLISMTLSAADYQKGVVLGLYEKDPNYTYETELKEIKNLGATHISLVTSWYQQDIYANEIYPRYKAVGDFETTPDAKLAQVIDRARALGLKVFLFPILRLEHRKPKEWRGVIAPTDLKTWRTNYRKFVLHYARIAAHHKIALYSVGSELCSQEKDAAFWKKLIADVRSLFKGELTYSANWDHYKKIEFWDDLDYLGLNGYYEMAKSDTPTVPAVVRRWWDISNEIANWQVTHKKKLIFTEIGYPSVDGGCAQPWDYTRQAPVDLSEQAVCYEAFFLSWHSSRHLAGVYFWNWYGQGGENDRSYTPRGKPAEKILIRWYRNASNLSPSAESSESSESLPSRPSSAAGVPTAVPPPTSSAAPASPSSSKPIPTPPAPAKP